MWDEPGYDRCLRRVASYGRLILFGDVVEDAMGVVADKPEVQFQ